MLSIFVVRSSAKVLPFAFSDFKKFVVDQVGGAGIATLTIGAESKFRD